jgi:hypothetical protein
MIEQMDGDAISAVDFSGFAGQSGLRGKRYGNLVDKATLRA